MNLESGCAAGLPLQVLLAPVPWQVRPPVQAASPPTQQGWVTPPHAAQVPRRTAPAARASGAVVVGRATVAAGLARATTPAHLPALHVVPVAVHLGVTPPPGSQQFWVSAPQGASTVPHEPFEQVPAKPSSPRLRDCAPGRHRRCPRRCWRRCSSRRRCRSCPGSMARRGRRTSRSTPRRGRCHRSARRCPPRRRRRVLVTGASPGPRSRCRHRRRRRGLSALACPPWPLLPAWPPVPPVPPLPPLPDAPPFLGGFCFRSSSPQPGALDQQRHARQQGQDDQTGPRRGDDVVVAEARPMS